MLSPAAGAAARFSIPFFQGVSYDATFESVDVPAGVLAEKRAFEERETEGDGRASGAGARAGDEDAVEFTFVRGRWKHLGEATLWNRCKSHADVAQRWYPEIWREICEAREREEREKAGKEEGSRTGVEGRLLAVGTVAAGDAVKASGGTAIQAH